MMPTKRYVFIYFYAMLALYGSNITKSKELFEIILSKKHKDGLEYNSILYIWLIKKALNEEETSIKEKYLEQKEKTEKDCKKRSAFHDNFRTVKKLLETINESGEVLDLDKLCEIRSGLKDISYLNQVFK